MLSVIHLKYWLGIYRIKIIKSIALGFEEVLSASVLELIRLDY